jgi:hypothetical protein
MQNVLNRSADAEILKFIQIESSEDEKARPENRAKLLLKKSQNIINRETF